MECRAQVQQQQQGKRAMIVLVSVEQSTTDIQQPEVKVTKKISLNRKTIDDAGKAAEDVEKVDVGDKVAEEKPAKKRKWGSRTASTTQKTKKTSSIPISTESLKGLIPDIKPSLKLAPEPVMEDEMDYEDDTTTTEQVVTEQEDTRSVKIQRTVTQDVKKDADSDENDSEGEVDKDIREVKPKDASGDESGEDDSNDGNEVKTDVTVEIKEERSMEEGPVEEGEESKVKEEVKQTKTVTVTKVKKEKRDKNKEIKLIRRLDSGGSTLVKPDEPIRSERSPSPARNPASKIIHIRNLVRPFTVNQLKELLKRNGNLNEELFWIDKIKSHCFAVYETEEEAIEARKALHNTTWPLSNPKTLIVDFGSEEQMDYYRGDEKPIPAPDKKEKSSVREQKQKEKEEKQRLMQEERQKEIERRQKEREKRMKERLEKEGHDRAKPVREWDKDKKSREDWDRTLQKSRSRSPRDHKGQRSRSGSPVREKRRDRSRERSRERAGRKDKKKGLEKKEDEPPAKLLDDLFKKTKITPSIYWLPLTEAQIAEREKFWKTRPLLRQKQEGDRVSPMREVPEGERPVARRRQTNSPLANRKLSQEGVGDRGRGRRPSPERRRRESSPDPRSRSGGRRR
ncbi:apoptotic chromatin condensation inducer in the nucleus-like [Ruditapes philippinarum]|uniref:apoptotic chromatin condensation inducer in the nucleus-like n=1 Tax=Ruditapes philippinarum TaxID=129788 RepID=UPI00295B9259|nr:apoptotic chromatin condensation inducer in the nucleus-like [Ruditapes philippinarum]